MSVFARHFLSGGERSTGTAAAPVLRRKGAGPTGSLVEAGLSASDCQRFSEATEIVCEEEALAEG